MPNVAYTQDPMEAAIRRAVDDAVRKDRERIAFMIEHYTNGHIGGADTWSEGFKFAKKMLARNVRDMPV